jgi:PBS lyase HEAT-like repeat
MTRARGIGTALLLATLLGISGCPSNPYSADTWIDKLDDPNDAERAVTELEHLGDPKAIPALGKAWEDGGRPQRLLQVIIELAPALTPEQADKGNFVDFAKTGRKASWDQAMPFLKKALTEIDEASPRSIENAGKAADALGDAQTDDSLDSLITALGANYGPKAQAVRLSVILALGKYHDGKAVKALSDVLRNNPEAQPLPIIAAAVNALADIKSPDALPVLIETMYRVAPIFSQTRRALVASGPAVDDRLRAILRGDDKVVNQLFKEQRLDQYCGDKNPETGKIDKPVTPCKPTSIKEFYAAVLLGDLYNPAAVPDLLGALKQPPLPVFYANGNPSPNSQYNGIYDSLRKIGSAEAAGPLRAVWSDSKGDIQNRALAIGAYAFVARSKDADTDGLGKIAADNKADDGLRQEAATAFARLATSPKDMGVLLELAGKYRKAADEARAKADGKPKTAYDKAKKEYDKAHKALSAAKAKLAAEGGFKHAKAETINAMTAAQKEVDKIDEPYDDARAAWKPLDNAARDYRGYERMFETHVARIEIYVHCHGQSDAAACYAKTLDAVTDKKDKASKDAAKKAQDEIAARVGKYVKTLGSTKGDNVWTENDKKGLVAAEIERAMLELGKMGHQAESQTGVLLDSAASADRLVRQSVLLALPKIAKLPCAECKTKLDTAIKLSKGKSELAQLNVETIVLRNYFSWAGTK